MAGINGSETEDVAEECAIRLRLFAVDYYMGAEDHLASFGVV
jgi:hypothetical protein